MSQLLKSDRLDTECLRCVATWDVTIHRRPVHRRAGAQNLVRATKVMPTVNSALHTQVNKVSGCNSEGASEGVRGVATKQTPATGAFPINKHLHSLLS